jgi:hypothetical protein
MARGWESKSVEAQMESAVEAAPSPSTRHLTKPELELRRQKQSLLLSRTRVVADLEAATNPRYKKLLEDSLAELDRKLAEFT